jgi:prevent-host-death family protein
MNVSVRDLKNSLSAYLRRARAGERLVVTERGRPIAELRALKMDDLEPEERLARLEELGELQRPVGRGLSDFKPMRIKGRPLSTTLLEDRG